MGDYAGICILSKGIDYTDEEQLIWNKRNLTFSIDELIEENGILYSKCHVINGDRKVEELAVGFIEDNNECLYHVKQASPRSVYPL